MAASCVGLSYATSGKCAKCANPQTRKRRNVSLESGEPVTLATRQRQQVYVPHVPDASSYASDSDSHEAADSDEDSGSSGHVQPSVSLQYTDGKPSYETQPRGYAMMPKQLQEAAVGLTTGLARSLNPASTSRATSSSLTHWYPTLTHCVPQRWTRPNYLR